MKLISSCRAGSYLSVRSAAFASRLYCPMTQIVDGFVVLFNDPFKKYNKQAEQAFRDDIKSGGLVENYNYFEINPLGLGETDDDAIVNGDAYLTEVAYTMKEAWQAWLTYQYPDRKFETYISDEDFEHVGFHEKI